MALAAASVLGLWGSEAAALSLGRIVTQSALGEPLRAEIEILEINDDEATSLRPRVAQPEVFRTSGLEYSAALNGLDISLQRRANGERYLRLSNSLPVNDPYVDLILEATWSSGRIVRDYTMLFDPPNLNGGAATTAPQAPQVSSAPVRVALPASETPVATPAAPAEAASAPAAAQPVAEATSPAPTPAPAAAAAPKTSNTSPTAPAVAGHSSVTVKAGDTASKLALAQKSADVSLDQMLVAMLRANPEAFVNGNVNRLRKGAVLDMPGSTEAQATSTEEARQILTAQSKDFNEYRRRLASTAPASPEVAADRKSGGSVQTQVEAKKSAPTAPDKLTLSKGAVQPKASEEQLAKERSAKEAADRAAALSKNVAELEKLSKAATPAPTATATKPAAPAATPAPVIPAPAASSPAPQVAATPVAPASAPAPKPRPAASAPAPAPVVQEPSMLDELFDNPLIPAAAGGLVALLAGLAFYRSRRSKSNTGAEVDSAYLESRLQPDSFFGNSGGQRVDTNDASMNSSSSMVYSPSQLDAGDDVDPVAEADVYLAYGRDLQAEEILKEALRNHPSRIAIHQKLLEIYAKRRDAKNFGIIAKDAYKVTGGHGPEWDHICELGHGIDPGNEMYQPGGEPPPSVPAPLQATPDNSYTAPEPVRQAATAAPLAAAAPSAGVDLDLDLDFSLDEESAAAPRTSTQPSPMATAPDNSLDFEAPPLPSINAPATAAAPAADNMMNFDMGGLSLDLGTPSEQPITGNEDPLATKLALADEFKAIGDTDGARALIEEIIAEASGDMKSRAQQALAALG